MFCPKCGTQNPDSGKFCRNCGTDLATVSDVLAGKSAGKSMMTRPTEPFGLTNHKGKPVHWEGAFGKLFSGIAFLVVSIVLAFSAMGNGWWFWMLIPAFSCLGAGMAQMMQLRRAEKQGILPISQAAPNKLREKSAASSLPPPQTEFIAPESRYKTGDLVPPSVTDGTTRHLEMNSEGETMTLPKKERF